VLLSQPTQAGRLCYFHSQHRRDTCATFTANTGEMPVLLFIIIFNLIIFKVTSHSTATAPAAAATHHRRLYGGVLDDILDVFREQDRRIAGVTSGGGGLFQ